METARKFVNLYISLLREAYFDIEEAFYSETMRGFALATLILIPIFGSLLFLTILVNVGNSESVKKSSSSSALVEEVSHEYDPNAKRNTVLVTWVSEPKVVRAELDRYYEETGTLAVGKASHNEKECTVYAPEPSAENLDWYFKVLGHEVAHCFRSDYHN
jgi:hypothetical protein